jgi:hypothetical protein
MKIYFFKDNQIHFNTDSNQIICPRLNVAFNSKFEVINKSDFLRFLRCKYSNKDRFMSNFIEPIRNGVGNLDLLDTDVMKNLLIVVIENLMMKIQLKIFLQLILLLTNLK